MKKPSPDKAVEVASSVCIGEPSDLSSRVQDSMLQAVGKERRARSIRRLSTGGVLALLAGAFFLFRAADRPTSPNPVAARPSPVESGSDVGAPRDPVERADPKLPNISVFSTNDLELSVTSFQTADIDLVDVTVFDDAAAMAWCRKQRIGYGFIRLGSGEKRFVVAEVMD